MTLPVRTALEKLARNGVHLPDLSDDEYLAVAEIMVREHGTTFSATFLDFNAVVNRIVDRRKLGEVGGHAVGPGHGNAPASPNDFEIADKVADVIRLHAPRSAVHPACLAAWNEGAMACAHCTLRLCKDDYCDHEVCQRFYAGEGDA